MANAGRTQGHRTTMFLYITFPTDYSIYIRMLRPSVVSGPVHPPSFLCTTNIAHHCPSLLEYFYLRYLSLLYSLTMCLFQHSAPMLAQSEGVTDPVTSSTPGTTMHLCCGCGSANIYQIQPQCVICYHITCPRCVYIRPSK